MKRILMLLTVVALMVVMLAMSVAPAFAFNGHPPPAAANSCGAQSPVTPQPCEEAGTSPPPGIIKK